MTFRFNAAIGGAVVVDTTEADLLALGHPPAQVAAAAAIAKAAAVEAEMRRRIAAAWAGKRASAQSYWTALVAKGAAASADEAADRDALAAGDAWESAMLDAAKALAARGDLEAARTDGPWPAMPAALAALVAQPFAL